VRAHQLLPTPEQQQARVEFTLAWHLHLAGHRDSAERHFLRAGELAPRDWTIRRGSLPIRGIDPMQSPEFLQLWQEGAPAYPAPPLQEDRGRPRRSPRRRPKLPRLPPPPRRARHPLDARAPWMARWRGAQVQRGRGQSAVA
jgi:hypothetical protein